MPQPAGGWPVAIFGHGFTDSMYGAPWTVAAVLASQGIATLSINVVGHGGGALGTLNVLRAGGETPVALPAGGRGIDQDGNGMIDSTEGVNAAAPRTCIGSRDGLRQTVIDLMQLVRQIEVGIDVDGDGRADLDAQRIYYAGQSFGGIYGTILLGIEPSIPRRRAERARRLDHRGRAPQPRLPRADRDRAGLARAVADQPAAGAGRAVAVQPAVQREHAAARPAAGGQHRARRDRHRRATRPRRVGAQAGNPVSYAPFIRKQPLRGHAAKPVIFQFAKGDVTVPNPTTSAILRAGDLADRATYYRNDLAYAVNPAVGKNPHTFLTNIVNPAAAPAALGAQAQIAAFFASHGLTVIDPDGGGPLFEVPINGALPETLNFIP